MNTSQLLHRSFLKDPLLIFRLWLGLTFINHGLPGIFNADYMAGFAGFLRTIDMPFAALMAYISKGGEFICGSFLLLGLFTRFAAIFVIIDMTIATFFALRGDIFDDFQAEISFIYLLMGIVFALHGSTSYSLDRQFWKKESPFRT